VIGTKVRVVADFQILEILEGVCSAAKPQAKVRQMFQALEFLHKCVDFHKLLKRSAGTREPGIEPFVVRKVIEHRVIVLYEEFVDDARM
jgi:hypothetical protein